MALVTGVWGWKSRGRWDRAVAAMALLVAGLSLGSSRAAEVVSIEVLSNRADLISGGDALVRVELPSGVSASDVTMMLGSTDVTSQFAVRPNGKYQGVLTGLALGPNTLKALLPGGSGAQITITNHPAGGPVFSGPQVQPWTCNAGATSPKCDRPVSYSFQFMPVGGAQLLPYDPANPPPALAIAETTTDQGHTVPYIVRTETGSLDRVQYQIAVLFDPAKPWEPWNSQPGWNHKLFAPGGANCGLQYNEGTSPGVMNSWALSRGFAVASSAHLSSARSCSLVVGAESLMMVKERLIEAYGPIRYTFSIGGSGAAIVQQHIANAYPGLYDGLIPQASFEGAWDIAREGVDCSALHHYFDDPSMWAPGVVWTEPQKGFVDGDGLGLTTACKNDFDGYINYGENFSPAGYNVPGLGGTGISPEDAYDAESNPGGVRASFQDYAVSVMGQRPSEVWTAAEMTIGRGFGNWPWDNIGIQYGLNQFKAGLITAAQFIDLNAKVGGKDIDYNFQPQRSEADVASIGVAYRTGFDNEASNLDQVAIIDIEIPNNVEIHDYYRAFSMRARLDRAHGHHENQVIWVGSSSDAALDLMDRWLAAVETDTSNRSRAEKIVAAKPADAVDRCISAEAVQSEGPCLPVLPAYQGSPRMAAGGPLANDITKCQLTSLSRTGYYPARFTDAEWAQLQQIFPAGVCDFSLPGVAQQPTVPWLSYAGYTPGGPGGGQLMGPAPISTSL